MLRWNFLCANNHEKIKVSQVCFFSRRGAESAENFIPSPIFMRYAETHTTVREREVTT